MSYGAHRVCLARARQAEGQNVDAPIHEVSFSKTDELVPQLHRRPLVLEEPVPVQTGVSQVLPARSFDALLSLSTLRMRLSSASCSITSTSTGRASVVARRFCPR